jgi:acetyl esterase/lipase
MAESTTQPTTQPLYPHGAPGAVGREAGDVPTLTPYPANAPDGSSMLVFPGGGYGNLAKHEGEPVAQWLGTLGITAIVVHYRLGPRYRHPAMLQDAAYAVRTVRAMSREWKLDPARIGVLGFSAGGHLAACTALTKKRMYEKVDKADEVLSHEPNFVLLVYPAYLSDKGGALKPEFEVKKDSPPMFFALSANDAVTNEGSAALYLALTKNKVPAELHVYETGGHGYGMRKIPHPAASWPDRAADWMKSRGLLEKAKPSVEGKEKE